MAWLYNNSHNVIAICGCDTLAFLEESLGALKIPLSGETMTRIGEMFAPGQVSGDHYDAALMKLLDK
ncbi:hypothetical protein [Cupriavidus basilensis]|uniref:hypothetical protein n=1 Tax=Cupriavidus basilensis TaxID=68895 RepID=UPI0023E8D1C0|nr:hypothetical protein [Cupriavidus basilensis]MDF3884607.1 hypothetical protein [Cupriavidus basilensis]